MIFSELYSAYYNTVASIITHIIEGEHSERELQGIVTKRAFGESALTIMPSLKSERWQLVNKDMTTPIKSIPTMPLTTLQKQWLKAISLDPRIKLFGVSFPDLSSVEPLFTSEDYLIYDKYGDGDPFEDEEYVRQFRVVLDAIKNGDPTMDISACPDLGPIIFALAGVSNGATVKGTARLKIKESDRCQAMKEELSKLGIDVHVYDNYVRINAPKELKKPREVLYGHNDHRIVMALSVISSLVGATIDGAEAVSKSFPDFFNVIGSLGIEVTYEQAN